MINVNQQALLELLKASLFGIMPRFPEGVDWDAVLQEAKDHTVVALAAPAVPEKEAEKWCIPARRNMSTRREIQMCQLEILKSVAKVCEENNIEYTLACGSLIGAIRHKGFIPWDDDIDISMTIENYKKFCKISQKCLGEGFFVQNWRTEKAFSELWTQVRMENTTSMPLKFKNWDIHFGIHIDVFPIIGLYNDEKKRAEQIKWFNICKSMLAKDYMCAVNEKPQGKQKIINRIPRIIRRMICGCYEKKLMISPRKTDVATELWIDLNNRYKSKLFYEYTTVEFEGINVKAIRGYDEYLTITYGDYMTPPPESERRGHAGLVLDTVKDTTKSFRDYLDVQSKRE